MARPKKNPDFITNICVGCNKEYTISYRKKHQRFCSKSCAQNTSSVKDKMKSSQLKTYREKYGCDHPMKTKGVVDNFKKSMVDKYGVEHALKSSVFLNKSKLTKIDRYGDENYVNAEKGKKTCLLRYGVDNFVKTDLYKEKNKKTCLEKYGVEHSSKSRQFKLSHTSSMFEKFLKNDRFTNFTPMFSTNEYLGVTGSNSSVRYPFKCRRCDNVDTYNLSNGSPIHCVNCDKNNSSYFQKEIYDYVKLLVGNETLVLMNDKTVLSPQELDIYIPSLNFAIECNGIYWHSEVTGGKNKVYHINKTKRCVVKNIRLIHIFENEWNTKKDIVKSILSNILKKSPIKIAARKCEVKIITDKSDSPFLENNHIQGDVNSSVKIGLYHNNDLVSVMTFVKSRFDKKCEYEMARYCNKLNTTIVGGASKLFNHFIKNYDPKSIVSYNDRRYFSGEVYLNLGFTFIYNSTPNYWYVIDEYKTLKNRVCFQKHKLSKILTGFNPVLTEWENMKSNGYDRIWDCGNGKWVYNKG